MKIGIIINFNKIQTYENKRFRNEAVKSEISLIFLDRLKLDFVISDKCNIFYDSKILKGIDYFIPRTGSATNLNDKAFLNALKLANKNVLNSGDVIFDLMDKQSVLMRLSQKNIKVVKTMLINHLNIDIVNSEFNYPLVLKQNTGSLGYGIYKIDTKEQLRDMVDVAFYSKNSSDFLIQEFIASDSPADYRIIVLKGIVIGAMKRSAKKGEFITNFSNDGDVSTFNPSEDLINRSIKISKILKCDICGIDYLKKDDDYLVCEVNSAPGFHGMELANKGLNIPKMIYNILREEMN